MQYVGVILFIICIVHYVYQVIILPSIRQSARDELFVLRDKLRARLIEVQGVSDKKTLRAFKEVDTGINRSLNRLHMLTFSNFVRITIHMEQPSKKNEESRKKFHSLLENADDEMPLEIFQEVGRVLQNTLVMNSLMFVVYLSPIVLVIKFIASIYERIKNIENIMLDRVIIQRDIRGQNCPTDKQLIA
ncbi:hypothetical protein A6D98_19365 [Aliivibrio fischeri]|uniref:hypothetical protein n=1 Tax=Aliivibrio fischeri TaxID=668 RepID=UPI00080EA5AD|nr:hypothetical protein [Aliivibrio fischeri]OCH57561.1 hypothetical protein A6D98_19365 [Aliivibrio fischeri]